MKLLKFIILILLFLPFFTTGQNTFPSTISGNTSNRTMVVHEGASKFKRGIVTAYFADTTAANAVSYIRLTPRIIIQTAGNQIWFRNDDANTWLLINGGNGITDGNKSDITVSSTGTVWTINNSAVTAAKLAGSIDSSKIPDLHSQGYYDGRYKPIAYNPTLQNVLSNGSQLNLYGGATIDANTGNFFIQKAASIELKTNYSGYTNLSSLYMSNAGVVINGTRPGINSTQLSLGTESFVGTVAIPITSKIPAVLSSIGAGVRYCVAVDSNVIKLNSDAVIASGLMNYNTDQSASYTARSLVDKGFVEGRDQTLLTPRGIERSFSITGDTVTLKGYCKTVSTASASTITVNADTTDMYTVTALGTDITIAAPTGTLHNGQKLTYRIKDNGTARNITWNSIFRSSNKDTLPTTTLVNGTKYVQLYYNTSDSKFDCVGVSVFPSSAPSFALWNSGDKAAGITLTGSNLIATGSANGSTHEMVRATVGKSSGKWYWEITVTTGNSGSVGVVTSAAGLNTILGGETTSWGWKDDGEGITNNANVFFGSSWTTADVLGFKLDMDAGTLEVLKNNTTVNTFTGLSGTIYPAVSSGVFSACTYTANFGGSAFTYTVPGGYNSGIF